MPVWLNQSLSAYASELVVFFLSGLLIFGYAMYWEKQDRFRQSYLSDTAFWLHCLAASLIVHPVFTFLDMFQVKQSLTTSFLVIGCYGFFAVVSLLINRRALMVAALFYLLYAFSTILKLSGIDNDSWALTGVILGFLLILLSVFWNPCRKILLGMLPEFMRLGLSSLVVID